MAYICWTKYTNQAFTRDMGDGVKAAREGARRRVLRRLFCGGLDEANTDPSRSVRFVHLPADLLGNGWGQMATPRPCSCTSHRPKRTQQQRHHRRRH